MISFVNAFKQGLHDKRRQTGLWMTTGSATMTEIAAGAGLDWLLVDMEHSPNLAPASPGRSAESDGRVAGTRRWRRPGSAASATGRRRA